MINRRRKATKQTAERKRFKCAESSRTNTTKYMLQKEQIEQDTGRNNIKPRK